MKIDIAAEGQPKGFSFENCPRYELLNNEIGNQKLHRHYPNLTSKTNLCNEFKLMTTQIFHFSNSMLLKNGFKCPTAVKTGTTIVGIVFKDGVILGADTRATSGPIVASKNCEKIHFLAKNM